MYKLLDLRYLKNRQMGALTLTTVLFYFGATLFGVFAPIYLWGLGYEIWEICVFFFLESVAFLVILFSCTSWLQGVTDRLLFSLSIPALVTYLIGLNYLPEYPILFFVLPVFQALNRLCFDWAHALDFAIGSTNEFVGRQIGFQNTLISISTFLAPLAGSYLIIHYGFISIFIISSIVMISALIPLFLYSANKISSEISRPLLLKYISNKGTLPHSLSCAGYAAESVIGRYLWPLYLFIFLGSISTFGIIISVGMFVATVAGYIAGYYSDNGGRNKLIQFLSIAQAGTYISRILVSTPLGLIAAHLSSAVILKSLHTPWGTYNYELAKKTKHIAVFVMSRITIYHIARIILWPILIILSFLLENEIFFITSFAMASVFTLMYIFTTNQQPLRS